MRIKSAVTITMLRKRIEVAIAAGLGVVAIDPDGRIVCSGSHATTATTKDLASTFNSTKADDWFANKTQSS